MRGYLILSTLLAICLSAGRAAPIHTAVQAGDVAQVTAILAADPTQVNATDWRYVPPLCVAVQVRSTEMIGLLMKQGADPSLCGGRDGKSAMGVAMADPAMLAALLDSGADLNARTQDGRTALHRLALLRAWGRQAAEEQAAGLQAAEILLQHGAKATVQDCASMTPLHQAAVRGNTALLALLVAKAGDVNMQNFYGETPLHMAADAGETACVQTLLRAGAALEVRDRTGATPLLRAVAEGRGGVVAALLAAGAAVDACDDQGRTPLVRAYTSAWYPLLPALLGKMTRAQINLRDVTGMTVLLWAARRQDTEYALMLLDAGADPNVADYEGKSPLMVFVTQDVPTVPMALLKQGADVHARALDGSTALHLVRTGEIARLLLGKGADVNARDAAGRTPLAVANAKKNTEVAAVLVAHGGVE